jgi:hypothetical protein
METNETSNQLTLVRADGTTTCCNAYTTIHSVEHPAKVGGVLAGHPAKVGFSDTHTEYCKACLEDVQGTTD